VSDDCSFEKLKLLLARVPAIRTPIIGAGVFEGGGWYTKFGLDIRHKLAWNVVQEFGHI
jgi:hypothetical protein